LEVRQLGRDSFLILRTCSQQTSSRHVEVLDGAKDTFVATRELFREEHPEALLLVVDKQGNPQYNIRLGEGAIISMVQASDGGYVLAGYVKSWRGDQDAWLVKVDSEGNLLWEKTFGTENKEEIYYVVQTSDGGYLLSGSGGYQRAWLIKTDSWGNRQWDRMYGVEGQWPCSDPIETADGYTFVIGPRPFLLEADKNGNLLLMKDLPYSEPCSLVQTADGGYIIRGQQEAAVVLYKVDRFGNLQWTKEIAEGLDTDEGLGSVIQTADEGFLVLCPAERREPEGSRKIETLLIKTDSAGNVQSTWTYEGMGECMCFSLTPALDEGYVLAGVTWASERGSCYPILIKTDYLPPPFGVKGGRSTLIWLVLIPVVCVPPLDWIGFRVSARKMWGATPRL